MSKQRHSVSCAPGQSISSTRQTVKAAQHRLARFHGKRVYSYGHRTGYALLSVKRVGVYKIGA